MVIDGAEYLPDYRGRFYCPFECHNPNFPAPHWSTEKGFSGHMTKCKGKPEEIGEWIVLPKPPRKIWGMCPDCGTTIYELQDSWMLPSKTVCYSNGCWKKYSDEGKGTLYPAGFDLPEMTLEG